MMSTPSTPIFTRRGYGCQREVYHPLSKHAESTAVMYYESSDEEDEVGEVGNTSLPPGAVKSTIVTPSSAATSLVLRRESAAVSTPTSTQTTPVKKTFVPKKPPMAVARKGPVDRKGKGTEKQSIFLLDEMAAMNLGKPGEPSSPVSKRPLPPPSTPPRQKRIPFSLLTPENTFGASSPFKIRANGSGGDREKEGGKENGSWGSSYDYGSIPGGFDDDVDLHSLFEIPRGTGVLFGDTQGSLLSFILFVASFAVEIIEFYMMLFDLHEGWGGVAL